MQSGISWCNSISTKDVKCRTASAKRTGEPGPLAPGEMIGLLLNVSEREPCVLAGIHRTRSRSLTVFDGDGANADFQLARPPIVSCLTVPGRRPPYAQNSVGTTNTNGNGHEGEDLVPEGLCSLHQAQRRRQTPPGEA